MFISIQELEAAINFWRDQSPSRGEALQLCPQAAALAKPYAMMIIQSSQRVPLDGLSDSAEYAERRKKGAGKVIRMPYFFPPSKNNEFVKQTSDVHHQ